MNQRKQIAVPRVSVEMSSINWGNGEHRYAVNMNGVMLACDESRAAAMFLARKLRRALRKGRGK